MSMSFYEPFYDWERFFDSDWLTPPPAQPPSRRRIQDPSGAVRAIRPAMDLHEDPGSNLVTASFEFPGLKKEDVHIDVQNDRLTVSAENRLSTEREESGYAVRERKYGRFLRTLQLPEGIKSDAVKASMDNGILTVKFPKSGPEQAPKRVTIE